MSRIEQIINEIEEYIESYGAAGTRNRWNIKCIKGNFLVVYREKE